MLSHPSHTGPVREAIDSIRPDSERAHHHLMTGWSKIASRFPDPSGAYREAVRGVEAAAKPVVTPNDDLATLGKMIRAIEGAPGKWTFVLGRTGGRGPGGWASVDQTTRQARHR
jgi:hypothetical protein